MKKKPVALPMETETFVFGQNYCKNHKNQKLNYPFKCHASEKSFIS